MVRTPPPHCIQAANGSPHSEFAPSRRGGNVKAKRKREREGSSLSPGGEDDAEPLEAHHPETARRSEEARAPSGAAQNGAASNGRVQYAPSHPHEMPPPSTYGMAPRPAGPTHGLPPQPQGYPHPAPLQPSRVPHQKSTMPVWPGDQPSSSYGTRFQGYAPASTQVQPPSYPSQPLISSGSPLRYSSLQNLLLPSPGGTNSSSYLSGESPALPTSGETTRPDPLPLQNDLSSSNRSAGASDSRSPRDGAAKRHKSGSDRGQRFDGGRSTQHSIVKADMHNESDALAILALASREVEHEGKNGTRHQHADEWDRDAGQRPTSSHGGVENPTTSARARENAAGRASVKSTHTEQERTSPAQGTKARGAGLRSSIPTEASVLEHLQEFDLVQRGIMAPGDVVKLSDDFFRRHHHIFVCGPEIFTPGFLANAALASSPWCLHRSSQKHRTKSRALP